MFSLSRPIKKLVFSFIFLENLSFSYPGRKLSLQQFLGGKGNFRENDTAC